MGWTFGFRDGTRKESEKAWEILEWDEMGQNVKHCFSRFLNFSCRSFFNTFNILTINS